MEFNHNTNQLDECFIVSFKQEMGIGGIPDSTFILVGFD